MRNLSAGWSSLAARRAHNPKVVGSNPTPATKVSKKPPLGLFLQVPESICRGNTEIWAVLRLVAILIGRCLNFWSGSLCPFFYVPKMYCVDAAGWQKITTAFAIHGGRKFLAYVKVQV